MNRRAIALLLFLFAASFLPADLTAQERAATRRFDPSGNYHPVRLPETPSERFIQINLRVKRHRGRLSAVGEVRNTGKWYRYSTKAVNRDRLRFETVTKDGVRYEFLGEFTGDGNFTHQWVGTGTVKLKGSLRKFVRGKQVVEIRSDFVHYPLH